MRISTRCTVRGGGSHIGVLESERRRERIRYEDLRFILQQAIPVRQSLGIHRLAWNEEHTQRRNSLSRFYTLIKAGMPSLLQPPALPQVFTNHRRKSTLRFRVSYFGQISLIVAGPAVLDAPLTSEQSFGRLVR